MTMVMMMITKNENREMIMITPLIFEDNRYFFSIGPCQCPTELGNTPSSIWQLKKEISETK